VRIYRGCGCPVLKIRKRGQAKDTQVTMSKVDRDKMEVREPEVVEGMQVNVGIWNDRGSWLAEFRRPCFGVDQ